MNKAIYFAAGVFVGSLPMARTGASAQASEVDRFIHAPS